MAKKDIKNYTLEELKQVLGDIQQPPYRAGQIFAWFYQKGVVDFNQMSNIPQALREELRRNYYIGNLELSKHLKSRDRTEKFLFKLADGNFIETVLIAAGRRKTVCLSTQVGCRFACAFCASGLKGFIRDLSVSEMTGQILFLRHNLKHKIANYVFMGIGEPLDNYDNLIKAIVIMNDPRAMDIGARRITISTSGIIPGITRLKELGLQVNLSVSLHAANNKLRGVLMPVNKRYPLEKLISACADFVERAGRKITLEYILIRDKNDSQQNADELAAVARRLKAKVNLIRCSAVPNLRWQPSQDKSVSLFLKRLMKKGVNVTLRESKGGDIQAGCGQLRVQELS